MCEHLPIGRLGRAPEMLLVGLAVVVALAPLEGPGDLGHGVPGPGALEAVGFAHLVEAVVSWLEDGERHLGLVRDLEAKVLPLDVEVVLHLDAVVARVLQLELGPGVVEDGKEGEVTSVAPVASNDEQGADDVEEVEPGVEGEQLAAGAQGVASLDLSEWPSKQN